MEIIKRQNSNYNLIFINMRFLTQRITGVQRFAYELCCELDKLVVNYPHIKIVGLLPNRPIQAQYDTSNFSAISLKSCGNFGGHLWEQLELPWFSHGEKLLNLCNAAPMLKSQQYITLHDVIFMTTLDSQKWWFKLWYRIMAQVTLKAAHQIFTVSEFSKAEISRLLRVKAERIKVLGNAPSLQRYAYEDNILSQLHVQSNEYFLMIGSSSVRKNTQVIAQLFAMDHMLADYKLVIVGGEYANLSAATSIQAENIVYTGYIGDGELRSLYRNAVALIFPSLYEGFGIPVIEAIAEHCLVIVSDIPVMREICGEHAIYFNPHNAEDLKKKLCVLLANPDLLYSNTKLANKQLIRYNWLKFAKILLWDLLEHGR